MYSRKIVGYHLAQSLHATGAIKALENALKEHGYPKGVVHHSDRGVQYCCHDFIDEIFKWKLRSSMTDADHCAQNALAECMNGIMKREFLLGLQFSTFAEAQKSVTEAISTYNHLRIHGSLKGHTPAEIHHGHSSAIEIWAKEIAAFHAPTHDLPKFSVNSI